MDGSILSDANGVEPAPGRAKDSGKWQKPRFSRKALMKCCLVKWIIASTQPQDKGESLMWSVGVGVGGGTHNRTVFKFITDQSLTAWTPCGSHWTGLTHCVGQLTPGVTDPVVSQRHAVIYQLGMTILNVGFDEVSHSCLTVHPMLFYKYVNDGCLSCC